MKTRFSPISASALQQAVDGLKKRNVNRTLLTNYFLQPLGALVNLQMAESEHNLCFLHEEWDFGRAYFFSFDTEEMAGFLESADWPSIVVSDWPSKGPPVVDSQLARLGFHLHTVYDRMVCPALRSERTYDLNCLASDADRDALAVLLLKVFDKYADHIISDQEIGDLIGLKQVILSRDAQKHITSLAIFRVTGQKCNFNFLYSSGSPLDLTRLLGNFYGVLAARNVRSGFGWVRRTRPLVLKLHQSFGWRTDGLVNHIYMRS